MAQTLRIRTPLQLLQTRSYTVASTQTDYLQASNANAFYEGEWMELDSDKHLIRGTTGGAGYLFIGETGAMDAQLLSKAPVIIGGVFEAETKLFTGTPSPGDALEVVAASYDGATRAILRTFTPASASGAHTSFVVGVALGVFGDWLRFVGYGAPRVVYYVVP